MNALENVVKPKLENTIAYIKVIVWPHTLFARTDKTSHTCMRTHPHTRNAHRLHWRTLHGFQGELDELEREEFFRLKKVQKNKQKALQKAGTGAQQQQQPKVGGAGGGGCLRHFLFSCLLRLTPQ